MKRAIVIGATSGIGKGLAKLLAKDRYHVGITGRRLELFEEIKKENPNSFTIKSFDVVDTTFIPEKLNELVLEIGGLDLLVICSGTGDLNNNLHFDIEKRTIDTNILGFTCIANWTFNYFEKQKNGHLVVITSIGGLRGSRQAPSYNASKAYQINYLEGLNQKATYLKIPITVTDIRPGFVDTNMAKGEGKFWVATVDYATKQMLDAILSKKKIVYITKRWKFIAMVLKVVPRSIYYRM